MIKDADAGAIILAIVGSLLVGGVAYALQRLSFYRNEKDIIPKIKSGELTEKDFVQAYREQAINRIKINEDKIIAEAEDHLFSAEDVVNLTKVELLKLKRELYRAKSINDLISIFPNDISLKRMKYLFDKSKLTKDSKGVKTMNLKRYIDAAVRREVKRYVKDEYNDPENNALIIRLSKCSSDPYWKGQVDRLKTEIANNKIGHVQALLRKLNKDFRYGQEQTPAMYESSDKARNIIVKLLHKFL